MKIKSIIVDDEQIARNVLRNYLTKYCPQVEILGEAENIKEAVPLIEKYRPQLVFLDVEMPYGNAFDILEATQNYDYETIFITAFSDYSMKALNFSASYYILKPIDIQELILAVNKVAESIEKKKNLIGTKFYSKIFNKNRKNSRLCYQQCRVLMSPELKILCDCKQMEILHKFI